MLTKYMIAAGLLALVAAPALAENDSQGHPVLPAHRGNPYPKAQQAPVSVDPITASVAVNWENLQTALGKALAALKERDTAIAAATAEAEADEARKATLIEWLRQAQSERAK